MDSILGQGLPGIESVNLFDDHLSNTRREMRANISLGMLLEGAYVLIGSLCLGFVDTFQELPVDGECVSVRVEVYSMMTVDHL